MAKLTDYVVPNMYKALTPAYIQGEALDRLGDMVGLQRCPSVSDADYRNCLLQRIATLGKVDMTEKMVHQAKELMQEKMDEEILNFLAPPTRWQQIVEEIE